MAVTRPYVDVHTTFGTFTIDVASTHAAGQFHDDPMNGGAGDAVKQVRDCISHGRYMVDQNGRYTLIEGGPMGFQYREGR